MRRILFICTGNYYRSRFAEAIFNYEANQRGLNIRAFSRGLMTWLVANDGPISSHTLRELKNLGVDLSHTGVNPVQLSENDLAGAERVIALKEAEHRAMMTKQFPEWADKIEYWHVHDLDAAVPDQALPEIYDLVQDLIASLAQGELNLSPTPTSSSKKKAKSRS